MSKGPGKTQRAILDMVESQGYCVLADMEGFFQPSLSRAARGLWKRNLVTFRHLELTRLGQGRLCVVLFPPNISQNELDAIRDKHGLWSISRKSGRCAELGIDFEDMHPVICQGCGQRYGISERVTEWTCWRCRRAKRQQQVEGNDNDLK